MAWVIPGGYRNASLLVGDVVIVTDGYIREHQQILSLNTLPYNQYLPSLVGNIVSMFLMWHEWDKVTKGWCIDISEDTGLIKHSNSGSSGNLFSRTVMSRNIHHFLFKIEAMDKAQANMLGVIEHDRKLLDCDGVDAWLCSQTVGLSLNGLCKKSDTIEMVADLSAPELRYRINNVDHGAPVQLKRTKYKCFLTIGGKGLWRVLSCRVTM